MTRPIHRGMSNGLLRRCHYASATLRRISRCQSECAPPAYTQAMHRVSRSNTCFRHPVFSRRGQSAIVFAGLHTIRPQERLSCRCWADRSAENYGTAGCSCVAFLCIVPLCEKFAFAFTIIVRWRFELHRPPLSPDCDPISEKFPDAKAHFQFAEVTRSGSGAVKFQPRNSIAK